MRIVSLLLFGLMLLAVPVVAANTAQPATPTPQTAEALTARLVTAEPLLTQESKADFSADGDDICYKIRAYIFKRDDDHAPQLAGTTTCGPRQPRAKDVEWPKARLVPAD